VAESSVEINRIIEEYRVVLAGLGVWCSEVYLYGSHAAGTADGDSDIDLIVVSKDFLGKNIRERLEVLGVAAARIMKPIQALGFTPEELHSLPSGTFAHEALTHARRAA
jgi:predicted nucleotidyltransferase